MPDMRIPAEEDREQVRERILAAFQGVPMPGEEQILYPPGSGDEFVDRRIVRELAGARWESLSLDFLKRRWSYFGYLGPEALAYFLPALLTNALDQVGADLFPAAVFHLTPSAYAVYEEGNDSRFEERVSLFTDEQQAAVVDFLGLLLDPDDPHPLSFRAARAFWLGWDIEDMSEGEPFREFLSEMRHFEYPEPSDPHAAELVRAIWDAFDQAPYPGDENICAVPEDADEPAEYALEFAGLDWRAIHPALLAQNYAALSFFTDEGFRYFLPAYLVADLTDLGIPSAANPVLHLTSGLAQLEPQEDEAPGLSISVPGLTARQDWRETLKEQGSEDGEQDPFTLSAARMSVFSPAERQAIIHYLEYRAAGDEETAAEIGDAIDRYWIPSLDQAED